MLCVKVCFYFVVTFITRSLSVVAALFVHFSHFLMTTLSRTWPKGFPFMCRENYEFEWQESCAEWTNESRFPLSCPSPASLLLGFLFCFFFLMSCHGQAELSLCYLSVRDYEKLMKWQEGERHLKVIFIYLLSLWGSLDSGKGRGAAEMSPTTFRCCATLSVTMWTWRGRY